jgi:hypothetical protein
VRNLWFNFDAGDRLVSLIAIRKDQSAEAIGGAFARVADALNREAGAPASASGDSSPQGLSACLLRQGSVEYRFRDYYALARATNMDDGFVLTEECRSLPTRG